MELRYNTLQIADGETATLELERLLGGSQMELVEREKLRYDLIRYCRHDTWGLGKLLERLHALVETAS